MTEEFVKQTTVYGGDEGLKLYIKKTAEIIWKLSDSGVKVKSVFISNIYVSKRNIQIPINFRQIRMYGTLYNYNGYGLNAVNYDGACVPKYLLNTYNNQEITNPRNKISKLNMPKLLNILGMENEYEGCSI